MVDSGIDAGHADLRGKVLLQKDFVNDDPVADDALGHGTHVAGIAAAATGNGAGISGGCPDCRLLVAKTMQGNYTCDNIDRSKKPVSGGMKWRSLRGR